jgi:UDP-N-acetylglucosamine acyltransferase
MIHPTAIVAPGVRIAASAVVGPYCVIGGSGDSGCDDIEIGEDCILDAHLCVQGPIRIGARNRFFPYSTVGVVPQDLKFKNEVSETVIGDGNTIREFVTIHRGTAGGGLVTRIGSNCLVMAYTHIAHDCQVGDHTVLGNAATLAGHVVIGDHVNLGAFSGVHQFCRIGRHAIVGGYSVITRDVMPYSNTVTERTARTFGANKIGLERRGYSSEAIAALHRAFRLLTAAKLNTSQAIEEIRSEPLTPEVEELLGFIESSERGVIK